MDRCVEIVKKRESERKEDSSSPSKDSCTSDDDPESITAPGKVSPMPAAAAAAVKSSSSPNGVEGDVSNPSEEDTAANKTRKLEADSSTAATAE